MTVKQEQIYKVHSGVRKRHTRLQRMQATGRVSFVQRFGGGSIVVRRVRPATITETQLKKHLDELQAAYDQGRAEVRTVTGQLVDLKTLEVVEPLPPSTPLPHPPLDSAANDKTFPGGVGQKMPLYREGRAIDEEVAPLPSTSLPGDEEEEAIVTQGGDPAAYRKKARSKKRE